KVKKSDFKVTDEIIELFGDGYEDEEYRLFYKKYLTLKDNYPQQTAMHTEAFLKYIRYAVKEEMSIANDDADEAKKWGEQANKAAIAAKINPNQMSKADLQGGVNTISEIALAVEQAQDITPILPKYKHRPNDTVDFTIWCYINYERGLSGMPLCDYGDVYKFYDERVESFIKNGGDASIFEGDPTVKNRERVEKFIEMPEDGDE
ncbi:hypothetical protein, partial [Chryseobacterium sp.]|uniref:hypothetical protein n=1 Tax=Chryseobacterium sp. TaxID=1871047 RepID=UPI002FCB7909